MFKKLCYALCVLPVLAHAHEITSNDPFTPILSVGGRYLQSDADYPAASLPNALEASAQAAYQQANAFDYADVGLQAQWTNDLKTLVKGSYHGQDLGNEFSIEQAWLHYDYDVDMNHMLSARLGRQNVALGRQNLAHSHSWIMGVEPLVMRASVADGWRDDGLAINWHHENGWYAGAGVYKGENFPSNKALGLNAVSTRLGWQQDDNYIEGSVAHFKVSGRATAQKTALTHSHSQASCEQATANIVCFEGKSQVAVLAAQWRLPHYKTTLNGEAWLKQEQGNLLSSTGQVDYTGLITGGWLMADYQFSPQLHSYLRVENLQGSHDLVGTNAALIANEAGISNSDERLYRTGLGVVFTANQGVRLSAEAHQENNVNKSNNTLFLFRYQIDLWTLSQGLRIARN